MKVAITGKGGVGKTTFSAVLARLYAAEGHKVLCADVDPDANLGLALGATEEELARITPITEMKEMACELARAGIDLKDVLSAVSEAYDSVNSK